MSDYIVGIDIGGTKISSIICSRNGILHNIQEPTEMAGDENALPVQVIEIFNRCCDSVGIGERDQIPLGISTPGPFQKINGQIELVSPNICGGLSPEKRLMNDWKSVPLERTIKRHHGQVVIENDAVSGVIAERKFGHGRGCDDLLYVTWSTGIGTGACVDGSIIRGKNGNAPHGGHIYISDEERICGCGNIGDLESLASGSAIAREYGKNSTAETVFKKYRSSDRGAVEIVERAAKWFSRGLASINAVLDTQLIIIGGGVFINNVDILLPFIEAEFRRSFPAMSDGVRILPSIFGPNLGNIGAISLVIPDEWEDEWQKNHRWEIR